MDLCILKKKCNLYVMSIYINNTELYMSFNFLFFVQNYSKVHVLATQETGAEELQV